LPARQARGVRSGPERGYGVVHTDQDHLWPVGAKLELARRYLSHSGSVRTLALRPTVSLQSPEG